MFQGSRVIGIVAEFNPFHEGHAYLIRNAKEKYKADYVVVAMSGDFVQRGEPAFFSKYERARKALSSGADLIFQLPVMFSTASAEDFAAAAVRLLEKCGLVDRLVFGSESGSLQRLTETAELLLTEDSGEGSRFSALMQERLRKGQSFPKAREEALRALLPETEGGERERFKANDVLGIEYLKAMKRQRVRMEAGILLRNRSLRSAHSIREDIIQGCGSSCDHKCYAEPDMLSEMLSYQLLRLSSEGIPLSGFSDVSEELANILLRDAGEKKSFRERIEAAKGKNLTYSRISRALTHILLNIRMEELFRQKSTEYAPYLRVLGASTRGREMLGALAEPPVVSLSRWMREHPEISESPIFRADLFASRIFAQIYKDYGNEFTEKLLIL